jgi:hypothetical protein
LNILNYERASGTGAVGKGLVLGKAVRVPRHSNSPNRDGGGRATSYLIFLFFSHKLNCEFGV